MPIEQPTAVRLATLRAEQAELLDTRPDWDEQEAAFLAPELAEIEDKISTCEFLLRRANSMVSRPGERHGVYDADGRPVACVTNYRECDNPHYGWTAGWYLDDARQLSQCTKFENEETARAYITNAAVAYSLKLALSSLAA